MSGYAKEALERLLDSSKGNPRLFPRYAAKDYFNPTTASATPCKYLKAVYGGENPHCLRNSMRDRLRKLRYP